MRRAIAACLTAALAASVPAKAADASLEAAGEIVRQKCQSCHGLDGLATIPEAPNLAGQNRNYLVRQLIAFRAGERKDEKMSPASFGLTDAEIAAAAAWYAAVPFTAALPD